MYVVMIRNNTLWDAVYANTILKEELWGKNG